MADISYGQFNGRTGQEHWSRLGRLIGGIIEKYQTYRSKRRALHELRALDDRMLADIGLNRGELTYRALDEIKKRTNGR